MSIFSSLQIRSFFGVILYAAVIGLVAILTALLLLRWLGGPDLPSQYYWIAVKIAAFLGPVLGWIGGLRNLHVWRLSQELTRLVNRDRLTDVATRDFFFKKLEEDEDAFGVSLMVDIDHFKEVNDTYGHLAGDAVILNVASVLKAQMRADDIVCRFGGEEFVVFLRSATAQEGEKIAERIRKSIAAAQTPTEQGAIGVTVSLGGSLKEQLENVEEAIKRADDCLYRAKAEGRNRIVMEWDHPKTVRLARHSG
jgi:diguanylate cyclase (GGDEF)-like protein